MTYLSPDGRFRLSRGNKGTLFVLVRDVPPKERLLEALESGRGDEAVEELIEELRRGGRGVAAPARSEVAVGKWRLRWTKQVGHLAMGGGPFAGMLAWHLHGGRAAGRQGCRAVGMNWRARRR